MDYKEKVKDKKDERNALDARWQVDEDLYYLKKYVMKDAKDEHKIPDVVNVTLNLPGRFANDVISVLGTAKEQPIVESEDKKLDSTEIEDFRRAAFGAANSRLKLQGKFELNPWWDFHSCIRGGAAARCFFRMENGILIPEITPWDIRYVTYEIGVNGLDWAAYETTRTKGAIEAEYGFVVNGKVGNVLDVWDTEHNEVWIDEKRITTIHDKKRVEELPNHIKGVCPVVIRSVVLGSMLAGDDSLEHQGEGIFFLIREAVPELERLLSIMQTLNLLALKPPKGWASKQGTTANAPEYDDAMRAASMTPHDIGGGVTDINFGDAQRSAQLAYDIMRESIREATVAASDLGIIESPPASGVRAMVAGESRDQLLSPRLGLKSQMNEGLADMFTAQVIQIGGTIELGTLGHKRKFQTSKLDGEYEGFYKYTIKSAAVDAGRASLSAAYGNSIPERAKRVEILQREDPDGDEEQLRWEEAERLSPAVKIYRTIVALKKRADEGDEDALFEANLLAGELGVNVDQLLAGDVSQMPKPEKEDEPTQVLSLFGGGAGRTKKEG